MTSTKSTSPAISSIATDRRRRVQHDAGFHAEALDEADRPVQMRQHLDVHRQHVGARLDERLGVAGRDR